MRFTYRLLVILVVVSVLLGLLGREIVVFWLNLSEFGNLYFKPLFFSFLGGLVLSTIALFRVDFKNRRSVTWWIIKLIVKLARSIGTGETGPPVLPDFESFKMPLLKFLMWQVTKVLVGTIFFTNVIFGMSLNAVIMGWNPNFEAFPRLFSLPFSTPPLDKSYAEDNVIPLIPILTLLAPPLLRSLWIRLILFAATHIIRVAAPLFAAYVLGLSMPGPRRLVSTMQALAAVVVSWLTFTSFFTPFIDYNTRYLILGLAAASIALAFFAILDKSKEAGLHPGSHSRQAYLRLGVLLAIGLAVGSMMVFNNTIANVRKLEMLGPYVSQAISVNRHLAELDKIVEVPYEFGLSSIPPSQIDDYVRKNRGLLEKVRLWDQQASFDKLRPEIGLIPYIDFADADILRFNGTLYWSASMDLILPQTVRPEDRWYAMHFVYTHVPSGFLMLDAHTGRIVDAARFFPQRRIYYGEGGLFQETWVAYPVGRTVSDEVGGYFYDGRGGVEIPPPLSWVFEPNFLLSYPATTMRVLRYRDVFERMQLLFPYFIYEIGGRRIDIWPVTDGEQTFWIMPLMVFLDAGKVPWSRGNHFGRLVGYALIDIYHGEIQLIITGEDFFSQMFKTVYGEYVSTSVPEWLKTQIRYPEELFEWRIAMYNFYHVTDASAFIAAKEFYIVPSGLDTYYIIAQPHGFKELEFVGILSLELRGALGENLAGYMVVRNDYPHTGEMFFFKVPLESETKLLGPTAINEALDRNPDYAALKTLLRNPRVGNQIFYRIGDYDVFFIPVYTAPGGGVVTQLGTIATVGADFSGEYYVGLGSTVAESFRAFLSRVAGVEAPPPPPEESEEERVSRLVKVFEEAGLMVLSPTAVNPDVSFHYGSTRYISDDDWTGVQLALKRILELCDTHQVKRVFVWRVDGKMNIGILVRVEDVVELHYVTVELAGGAAHETG
ncbi:MAG: UPF0182 family protein [Thermoproteota archaeon]|nr:UPF0182 family protein [Candidatus Brockarchaeota archaeon]